MVERAAAGWCYMLDITLKNMGSCWGMNLKKWLSILVGVALSAAGAGEADVERCNTWADCQLRVEFPSEIAGLHMSERTEYGGDWNYKLRSDSPESANREFEGAYASLCIYSSRNGVQLKDGDLLSAAQQIDQTKEELEFLETLKAGQRVEFARFARRMEQGKLKRCGLAYQWLGMRLKWAGATDPYTSFVVITTRDDGGR